MESLWQQLPHRRWNPLRGEWLLVSPHRTQRPWHGQTETAAKSAARAYEPSCYLCPGNLRANDEATPLYTSTYVFDNDFAALKLDVPAAALDVDGAGLLKARTERGICRVICFNPRHDLTLASMDSAGARSVVDMWVDQATELGAREEICYVLIFENRGSMMGTSNPHPHGQIWATEHVPNDPLSELRTQSEYFLATDEPLLIAYLRKELMYGERVVAENETWAVVVPFWAVWPYETLVLPRRSFASFAQMTEWERDGLGEILRRLAAGYNQVFDAPFPYSMGFHPAPSDGQPHAEWTLHAHFYPPLLRSATVRKFMVGFELMGSAQRDTTPESAAERLRKALA